MSRTRDDRFYKLSIYSILSERLLRSSIALTFTPGDQTFYLKSAESGQYLSAAGEPEDKQKVVAAEFPSRTLRGRMS